MSLSLENAKESLMPRLLPLVAAICFGPDERQRFWRKLSAQVHYDLSLSMALELYRERLIKRNSPLELVFDEIIRAYNEGQSLDAAFAGFVPIEEGMLIRAGQASGTLPETLDLCAKLIKAKQGIVGNLIGALAYPALLLVMLVVLLCTLSFYVLPELAHLADPESWGTAAKILFGVASLVASPLGLSVLAGLLAALILSLLSLPLWTGLLRVRLETLPPWSFYKLIHGSVWMFTVATLMRAGVSLQYILDDMLMGSALTPWLRERVSAIRRAWQDGNKLAVTLESIGFDFPDPELIEDLTAYESLPGFHNHLYSLAEDWLAQGQERIERKAKALNLILLSGIITLMCLLALGVTSLQQSLTTNMGA